jgi:hypothetical protein
MGIVSDKSCRENEKGHFMFSNFFFFEIRAVYVMWEKYGSVTQATVESITWRMRVACWITKLTNTYSVHVTLLRFL